MVGAIALSPTDAGSQDAVVGSAQRVVVARARAPRDAVVQHCLEYLGSEHPDFELDGGARSVVQFEGVPPEATPCVAYAPIDLDEQVSIVIDVPPEVYELVRLVVHLTRCPYAEYGGLRHRLRAYTHDFSLCLQYGETKRRAHDHNHPHHLSQLLGGLRDRPRHRQRKACPVAASPGLALRQLLPPAPPPPFYSSGALKRP